MTMSSMPKKASTGAKNPDFFDLLNATELLHQLLEDLIKDVLKGCDIDMPVCRAMILYRMGDKVLSAGDLKSKGLYMGSNPSYNQAQLCKKGLLRKVKSKTDGRAVVLKLTEKGRKFVEHFTAVMLKHSQYLAKVLDAENHAEFIAQMRSVSRQTEEQIRYIY